MHAHGRARARAYIYIYIYMKVMYLYNPIFHMLQMNVQYKLLKFIY